MLALDDFDFGTLIVDRSSADVERARQLIAKVNSGTATEGEIAECYNPTQKGSYNCTDVNRVCSAVKYLSELLEGYGYITGIGDVTRTMAINDNGRYSDGVKYIGDVKKLITSFMVEFTQLSKVQGFGDITVDVANNIEKALLLVKSTIETMETTFIPCGEALCGDDNL